MPTVTSGFLTLAVFRHRFQKREGGGPPEVIAPATTEDFLGIVTVTLDSGALIGHRNPLVDTVAVRWGVGRYTVMPDPPDFWKHSRGLAVEINDELMREIVRARNGGS